MAAPSMTPEERAKLAAMRERTEAMKTRKLSSAGDEARLAKHGVDKARVRLAAARRKAAAHPVAP